MVCLQFALDEGEPEIIHAKDPALPGLVEWVLTSTRMVGHVVEYDMAVLAAWGLRHGLGEQILQMIFQAYWEDRVTCTQVRQKLLDIARGCFEGNGFQKWGYHLDECARRMVGIELDKTDPWRLLYGTLYNTPVAEWPVEALHYCRGDVVAPRALHRAQEAHLDVLQDQFRQARYAFAKRLMECWGIRTERGAVERFHAQTLAESEVDRAVATQAGLVRPNGKRHLAPAMARMVDVYRGLEEDPPLTDKGREVQEEMVQARGVGKVTALEVWDAHKKYISLDEDACLASGDDILQAFQRFGSLKTTLSRVERLYYGTELPLQAQFQSIVATGRTSCRMGDVDPGVSPPSWGFQLQNLPRKAGLRECFVPRPGFVFSSVDYDGQELKSWAQVCLWAVGRSRLAQVLNEGLDAHTELAARIAGISKAEAYALQAAGDPHFKNFVRQVAKIGNFGYPGGMGPATLRVQARKEYRVVLTLRACQELREFWKVEWPEAPGYFAWVNGLVGDSLATIRHFVSERVRGQIPYTVTCNTFFQALTADAAKAAGFRLAWEAYAVPSSPLYGSRVVDMIHDEYLMEVPEGERGHHAAYRQAEVMREEAQRWHPDVKITCAPALMRRWSKDAKTVHNPDGMLIPYEDAA